jgi:hypothetical protein
MLTQSVNSKSNIKKSTNSDLPFSPAFPIAARYEATSTTSQTIINMSFTVDQSNKDAFCLYIDGKLLRDGASNDYLFTAVASDNTSSQVTLNLAISASLNIIAIKLSVKKELEFQTDNRFVTLYNIQSANSAGVTPGSTGTFSNVASISLIAGTWDVSGLVDLTTSGTTATQVKAAISTSSAALDSSNNGGIATMQSIPATGELYLGVGSRRLVLAVTTTIYLVAAVTYSVAGTMSHTVDSIITARQVK